MEILELLRTADSAPDVLAALSAYLASMPDIAAIPDWCRALPLQGEADVQARMLALVAVVNATSRHLRDRDCAAAKGLLQALAAATWALRPRRRRT